jgi:hypothetical protein
MHKNCSHKTSKKDSICEVWASLKANIKDDLKKLRGVWPG